MHGAILEVREESVLKRDGDTGVAEGGLIVSLKADPSDSVVGRFVVAIRSLQNQALQVAHLVETCWKAFKALVIVILGRHEYRP